MTGGSLKLSERSPTNHRGSRSKLHWIDGSTPSLTLKSNHNYDPSGPPVDTNQSISQIKAMLKLMTRQQGTHGSDVIMQGISPSNQQFLSYILTGMAGTQDAGEPKWSDVEDGSVIEM